MSAVLRSLELYSWNRKTCRSGEITSARYSTALSEYGYQSLLYASSHPFIVSSLTIQAAFASLAGVIIVLVSILDRMRMSPAILAPIECLCMCAMATSFGTALSFTLSLNVFGETRLNASTSADLMTFAMLVDLSRGYAIAAGVGGLLFLVACLMATVAASNRAGDKESCSFEPTASALGMGYGYAAITVPPTSSSRVPTMYDPRLPLPYDEENNLGESGAQEKESATKDVKTGRADSVVSEEGRISLELEKETTGPLSLEKLERVLLIRPSRPWSELPAATKVVAEGVHAI
jgi:hypothetical protein